jgi:hypothetical protein
LQLSEKEFIFVRLRLFREQQTECTGYKLVRASSIFLSGFLARKGLGRYGASGFFGADFLGHLTLI